MRFFTTIVLAALATTTALAAPVRETPRRSQEQVSKDPQAGLSRRFADVAGAEYARDVRDILQARKHELYPRREKPPPSRHDDPAKVIEEEENPPRLLPPAFTDGPLPAGIVAPPRPLPQPPAGAARPLPQPPAGAARPLPQPPAGANHPPQTPPGDAPGSRPASVQGPHPDSPAAPPPPPTRNEFEQGDRRGSAPF
ncbi:hypothetical protein EIP91_002163 [Steccherinum ochraceum]|uniref:Uncharacterized protein n=1 Tax=Steccherinum ochraceum TaxID=92696 RepID=A0A4R0RGE2_9APHY|nr:hypothetical protein EIP91_002163 [Steccherinum ochraceum]